MTRIAILLPIFIFLHVEKLQAKHHRDVLPNNGVEDNNSLDQYGSNYYQTIPTAGVQSIRNLFIKKLSENSNESQNNAITEPINLALVNSESDNDIFHQGVEDNTIQKGLAKSKLYERLARKADIANDLHRGSTSGPLKISLKSAGKSMKLQTNDKQSRILQDIRKLNPKEKELLKLQLQRAAPQTDILEIISLMQNEEKVLEDSPEAALEPEEDKLRESIKVEVNMEEDKKDSEDSNTFKDSSKSVIIEPSSKDETAKSHSTKSSEIPEYKSFSNSDISEKTRNHGINVIEPVPETYLSPNSVSCDVYCFRQYYFHFGNNYHCCVHFTSEYHGPCLQKCSCCVQNHYLQQNNFVQQNFPVTQQQHVSFQQQYVPHQQHYLSHQQHYLPVQQQYVPGQQLYQQNPTEGNYYWPYMYDRLAHSYKPYYV